MTAPSAARTLSGPAAVLAVVAAAACGDAEPPATDTAATSDVAAVVSADSTAIKACDLVTVDELERILDVKLEPARTTNDYAGDSKCKWDLPGDAQRGVSISLRVLPDLSLYEQVPGSEPVAGLGDAAVWSGTYGQLAVLDGGHVVSIALLVDDPERDAAEAVARIALAKL